MEDKDEHYCVLCSDTIYGLMNYVTHRKNGCQLEKKTKVASPQCFTNNCKQETNHEPNEGDVFVKDKSQTRRQSDHGAEKSQPLTTEQTSETRDCQDSSIASALDLSCQNEMNLAPNDRKKLPFKSSRKVDEVCIKVNKKQNIDVETVASLTVDKHLSTFTSNDKCSEFVLNQIDYLGSGAVTLATRENIDEDVCNSKHKEYGLLSASVIEGQDKSKTIDVPDLARKGKKRKRRKLGPKCKFSTKTAAHCTSNLVPSFDSEAFTKLLPNTGLLNPENAVPDTKKPSDDMVDQRTDVTSGIENDEKNGSLNFTIKSEHMNETDDIADDSHENEMQNRFERCKEYYLRDTSNEKALSDMERNTSFADTMECLVCDMKFESHLSLLKHLVLAISKDGTTETMQTMHQMSTLEYLSYISKLSPFQCAVCKFYFSRLEDFKCHLNSANHMSNTENILTEIICTQCNIKFSMLDNLEQHFLEFRHNKSKDTVHVITVVPNGVEDKVNKHSLNSRADENMEQPANIDNSEALTEHTDETPQVTDMDLDLDNDGINEFETKIKVDPDDDMENYVQSTNELSSADTYDTELKYKVDEHTIRFDEEFTELPKSHGVKTSNSKANNQKKKKIDCKHCSFTSDIDADMKFHYLDQHIELTHKCDVCDIVFLTSGNYRKHSNSKEHQANIEKLGANRLSQEFYQCHVCKKKFTSEDYCKFHTALQHFHFKSEECLLQHPSITRDKYADYLASIAKESAKARCKCPDCGSVVSKNSMMAHLRLHTGEQPFQCKLCVESFVNMTSLRRHLGVHFNIFSKSCEICGQQFKRMEHYNSHLSLHKAVAVESKSHVCEVCGTSFYLAKQLRAHLYKHQEKTLKCEQPGCQWSFHSKHDLKMHKLTHSSDENAFICATCGFTAKCRKYLKAHEKIHAKDVTLLECQFCEYKARKNTHMRRHMRIHLGAKPYKCPYCSYACNTHDNIRKHILETNIHCGLKVYPCKFCEYSTNSTKEFRSHLMSDHSDQVEDGARSKSLSSFTGLFVESEDLSVPEEGMAILPVSKRKNSRRSFKSEQDIKD